MKLPAFFVLVVVIVMTTASEVEKEKKIYRRASSVVMRELAGFNNHHHGDHGRSGHIHGDHGRSGHLHHHHGGNRTLMTDLVENIGSFLDSVHSTTRSRNNSLIRALNNQASYDDTSYPISLECRRDIEQWWNDAHQLKLYALQMRDSWAFREGGMLEGNVRWSGGYYECINAMTPSTFKPKYCSTYFGFRYIPFLGGVPYNIQVGTCFPSSCTEEMVQQLTGASMSGDIAVPAVHTECPVNDRFYDSFTIVIIVWSCVMVAMATMGTAADWWWRRKGEEKTNSFLLCFSVLRNGEKILSTQSSPNNIRAINGIRVISTLWVVLGHTVAMPITSMDNMLTLGKDVRERFEMMMILNGTNSVDTFFLIGGMLVSYLTLKQLNKNGGKLNVLSMYLHRYLRLTPMLAYCMLFITGVYKFLGDGPRWQESFEFSGGNCYDIWWTNLLYINNLYPAVNYCFGHVWYLACDFQFYLLSPFFVYLLYKSEVLGVVMTSSFTAASIGVTWWISSSSNAQTLAVQQSLLYTVLARIIFIPTGGMTSELTYEDKLKTDTYISPWCRISVYLIGILLGFILHKTQRRVKLSKMVVMLGWLVSVGTGLSVVYGLYGATSGPEMQEIQLAAAYTALNRPAWALAVGWVIFACTCGYGGAVTKFLDWKIWIPLSRLTYAVYLIHLYVIYWYAATLEGFIHYSPQWIAYSFSGHVIISFLLSFVVAILVEWPCQELLRHALMSPRHQGSGGRANEEKIEMDEPPSYRSDASSSSSSSEGVVKEDGKINPGFDHDQDEPKAIYSTQI